MADPIIVLGTNNESALSSQGSVFWTKDTVAMPGVIRTVNPDASGVAAFGGLRTLPVPTISLAGTWASVDVAVPVAFYIVDDTLGVAVWKKRFVGEQYNVTASHYNVDEYTVYAGQKVTSASADVAGTTLWVSKVIDSYDLIGGVWTESQTAPSIDSGYQASLDQLTLRDADPAHIRLVDAGNATDGTTDTVLDATLLNLVGSGHQTPTDPVAPVRRPDEVWWHQHVSAGNWKLVRATADGTRTSWTYTSGASLDPSIGSSALLDTDHLIWTGLVGDQWHLFELQNGVIKSYALPLSEFPRSNWVCVADFRFSNFNGYLLFTKSEFGVTSSGGGTADVYWDQLVGYGFVNNIKVSASAWTFTPGVAPTKYKDWTQILNTSYGG